MENFPWRFLKQPESSQRVKKCQPQNGRVCWSTRSFLVGFGFSGHKFHTQLEDSGNPFLFPVYFVTGCPTVDGSEILHHLGCMKPYK